MLRADQLGRSRSASTAPTERQCLVHRAGVDLVAALFGMRFGEVSPLSAIVYALVGLAAAYQVLFWKRVQARWAPASMHAR